MPIKYLFLTHCHFDHTGGADALRREFGCSIVAHEQDAVFLETGDSEVTAASWYQAKLTKFRIDHKIKAGKETFSVGNGSITALHAPGHSPGSMVLLTESRGQKVLFGQDVHGPLHPSLLSNREDYIASLAMLRGLRPIYSARAISASTGAGTMCGSLFSRLFLLPARAGV